MRVGVKQVTPENSPIKEKFSPIRPDKIVVPEDIASLAPPLEQSEFSENRFDLATPTYSLLSPPFIDSSQDGSLSPVTPATSVMLPMSTTPAFDRPITPADLKSAYKNEIEPRYLELVRVPTPLKDVNDMQITLAEHVANIHELGKQKPLPTEEVIEHFQKATALMDKIEARLQNVRIQEQEEQESRTSRRRLQAVFETIRQPLAPKQDQVINRFQRPTERLLSEDAAKLASELGFANRTKDVYFGRPVFADDDGRYAVTPDDTKHKGGAFKLLKRDRSRDSWVRVATLDEKGNKIGD